MNRRDPDRHGPGEATRGWSAERIALSDARFRDANDQISDSAIELGFSTAEIPFLCECADPSCHELIQMTLSDYDQIRADPTHFLNMPGHTAAAHAFGRVIEEHERYEVEEKLGRAREVAQLTDRRANEPPR